ncbi:hypothetical protein PRIPAC_77203 [Pristionchus pacificus]|nr:hypothetical protein PRIPAC_77203 [Pristionchus pacificus]
MSSIKFTLVFVLCLIAMMTPLTSAQCPSSNNARCSVWVQGGFCNTNFYTDMQKQFYCGNECGLCS